VSAGYCFTYNCTNGRKNSKWDPFCEVFWESSSGDPVLVFLSTLDPITGFQYASCEGGTGEVQIPLLKRQIKHSWMF
jgi:hypothetical protein